MTTPQKSRKSTSQPRDHCNLKIPTTLASAAAKLLQSCPTLCNPIGGSPPGSPVPGILQARTLEWVAYAFSSFHVLLAIVNSAAVNNGIHVSFSVLVSSGYMPRSGIAESYDGFIPSFIHMMNFIWS